MILSHIHIISSRIRKALGLLLPVITNVAETDITDVSATISASLTTNSYEAAVEVQYGSTPSLGSSVAPVGSPFAKSKDPVVFSVELRNLLPYTWVFYRIVVTTSKGPVATPVTPVIPAPTGLTATAESDTEISLSWTDNAVSDSFTVQRSLNGTDWTDIVSPLAPSYLDEELTPETLYYYRVKSVVDGISSEYSTAANATTQATAPPPDTAVYIDFDNSASGRDGSIANPFNSWSEVSLASDTEYKIKAGTSWTSSSALNLSGLSNVIITIYGTGDQPEFNYTGSGYAVNLENCHDCDLGFFDVNGVTITSGLIRCIGNSSVYASGNTFRSMNLYNAHNSSNAGFGVTGDYNDGLSFIGVNVDNVALDGGYLVRCNNLTILGGTWTRVNQRYLVNTNETISSGDGLQLDGSYDNFHISGLTIDRSDSGTGNKFCFIANNGTDASHNNTYTGIIEGCIFKTNANVHTAIHIHRGANIIIRYNRFEGLTRAIRLQGASVSNTLIHHNVFYNLINGVGIGCNYSTNLPNGPATGTKVFNNVFYNVSTYHVWLDQSNVEHRNNIHLRAADSGVAIYNYGGGSWTITNNCYGSSATAGTPGVGTNSQVGDPIFVDAANGDFHLQLTSICRNSGIDVNIDEDYDGVLIPQETNPAIGAFEYVAP